MRYAERTVRVDRVTLTVGYAGAGSAILRRPGAPAMASTHEVTVLEGGRRTLGGEHEHVIVDIALDLSSAPSERVLTPTALRTQ